VDFDLRGLFLQCRTVAAEEIVSADAKDFAYFARAAGVHDVAFFLLDMSSRTASVS
jgi:hypothetical protein